MGQSKIEASQFRVSNEERHFQTEKAKYRMARSLMAHILDLLHFSTLLDVSRFLKVSWNVIKKITKRSSRTSFSGWTNFWRSGQPIRRTIELLCTPSQQRKIRGHTQ